MSSSYPTIDDLEDLDDMENLEWSEETHHLPNYATLSFGYNELNAHSQYADDFAPIIPEQHYIDTTDGSTSAGGRFTQHAHEWIPQPAHSTSASNPEAFDEACQLLRSITSLPPQVHPVDKRGLQPQRPRFEGDLYTAPYIKGEGIKRMGWCAFCSSWHKLKDSNYWYHLHYAHGVSRLTGRQMIGPQKVQWNYQYNGWQGLCPRCNTWLTLGKGDRAAKTAYYRHAYPCHVRNNPQFERLNGVRNSRSPRPLTTR